MNKLYLFTLLLLTFFKGNSQTTYPSGVTGCLARWSFDNNGTITNVPDVSGNNHNGTAINLVSSPDFRNVANKAMYFNGTSSYSLVPHHPILNPQDITIVALVKPHSFYSDVCQGNNIVYKGFNYYIPGNWAMALIEQDANCNLNNPSTVALDFGGAVVTPPFPYPTIDPNKWYFFAVSFEGSVIKRYQVEMDPNNYVSGITTVSSTNSSQVLGSNTLDVRIGATQQPTFPYWFNGDMDEVVIFNKALTDAEVQSVYDYLWGTVVIDPSFSDTVFCGQDTFNVGYIVPNPGVFGTGNSFNMQLSDAAGNFTTPTVIGSVTATTSGTINCILPPGLPYSPNYKLRIASTTPAITSAEANVTLTIGHATTAAQISVTPANTLLWGTLATFTAAVTNAGTSVHYYWQKNSVDIPGVNSTSAVYTATAGADFTSNDTISAMVVVSDTVCDYVDTVYTNKQVMYIQLSVNEFRGNVTIQLHPNPNKGSFTIKVDDIPGKNAAVSIVNITGQQVYNGNIKTGIEEIIKMQDAAQGIYFLTISSASVKKTIKFTVL